MVSLSFLKQLDIFPRPIKIYYTKTLKKNEKKRYHEYLGSYVGFLFSAIIATIVTTYIFFRIKAINDGYFDRFETDVIKTSDKPTIVFNNSDPFHEFAPMISFSLYPNINNRDLSDLKEVFQIEDELDDYSDLKIMNITALN